MADMAEKLLALDTSTDVMSLAVAHGGRLWSRSLPGGAQSSATLLPQVLALLAEAGLRAQDLDAVVFGRGPGSFTGVRTACSVAQGLALGAGCPVLPVDTLLAVAEAARHQHGETRVLALLDARMDEIYAAYYEFESGVWRCEKGCVLISPENLVLQDWGDTAWAGNVWGPYGARLPAVPRSWTLLPCADALLRLAPSRLAAGQAVAPDLALPLYVRNKVAQTTAEREADKAARQLAPAQGQP